MESEKKDYIEKSSQDSSYLKVRLNVNEHRGKLDLNKFIFNNMEISGKEDVLDLGCGRGKQLFVLNEKIEGGKIYGVDISKESIDCIREKIGDKKNIFLINEDMDSFYNEMEEQKFDIIMSTYALYYSKSIDKLLPKLKYLLKENGKIYIVGPYGNNNYELFELIGFENIPDYVIYTSSKFMIRDVIPFIDKNFKKLRFSTAINPISYQNEEEVLDYWKNSTFYKHDFEQEISSNLKEHFKNNSSFIVSKHIMLCEGCDKN